ncbi:MAG: hypothetical protein LBO00_07645 [Zoogloeaceae bacterium]|jgi:ubiquinone biosynthesis protein UbiJ|nr:hypothetical protein [Zoogloeaceae bacterium]
MLIPGAPFVLALNHLVAAAEWARLKLEAFAGQRLLLEIGPARLGLAVTESGLFETREEASKENAGEGEADVHILLPPATPFLLLEGGMPRVLQDAQVRGNVEFAETLNFVFRHLAWDVEADLAAVVGDIPAHRLAQLGRATQARLRQAVENLRENVREYLLYEAGMLVTTGEFSRQAHAIGTFRDEVAALEKRILALPVANGA